jgi:methionyl-tRNA formyltransferase
MRVVLLGTGPFALPTLQALYDSPHEVLAVVTRPPRALHRKSSAEAQPIRAAALARPSPVLDPEDINAPAAVAALAALQPDVLVVCDYGQILRPAALAAARWGGVNLHASLLPRYRGAAPINWAVYHGESETGVSVIHMTPELDAGPILAQARWPIRPGDTAAALEPVLAALGAPLVLESISALAAGRATALPQDPALASRAPRLKKDQGRLDWRRSAVELDRQVRAFQPWPKSFTTWPRSGGEPLRLILDEVTPLAGSPPAPPGTILAAHGEQLRVATGQGALEVHAVQPAGKRRLSAGEFLRGYPLRPGDRFV